jgi:hypothetical protein
MNNDLPGKLYILKASCDNYQNINVFRQEVFYVIRWSRLELVKR